MSAAPGPGPIEEQKPATLALPSPTGFSAVLGGLAILPIVFLIVFHAGAGYLSYQKFGSMGWAALDFLFAYFYYPYYAFFLTSVPAEQPFSTTMMGGLRKMMRKMK